MRSPEFDINISAEPNAPFRRDQNNQMIMQLWEAGLFNPQIMQYAIVALDSMVFDNKEKLITDLQNLTQQIQMQQAKQQAQQQNIQNQAQAQMLQQQGQNPNLAQVQQDMQNQPVNDNSAYALARMMNTEGRPLVP